MSSLSERGRRLMNFTLKLADAWQTQQNNAFDEEKNPKGIINLGTSENKLMFDILMQKFSEKKSDEIPEHFTHYNSFHGLESFRSKIADLWNHFMKPVKQIRPNNLVVTNGCGSAVECLAMVLAQPGDGILVPAPFYGGFLADLYLRAEVKAFPVKLSSTLLPGESGPFELSVQRLEAAMVEAKKQNVKIRALLLCNPCNPFGTIYSEKLIRECLDFAHRNSLHVIMDEIYMLSVFGERSCMKNVLSLENIPDPSRLHVVWGFSKDFCVSGFRCGVLYTVNDEVLRACKSPSYFYGIPTTTQNLLMNLISDLEWLDNVYIPTNRRRLQESYKIVLDSLRGMKIPYVESESGFFVWVDFRRLLAKQTFEEEWKLFNAFIEAGVYIAPSQAFESTEPGWFRIIFSVKTSTLRLAMQRMSSLVSVLQSSHTQQDEVCNSAQTSRQESEAVSVERTESTSLEDLVRALHVQIKDSNWLQNNTAEKWIEENPEYAKDFMQPNAGS